MKLYHKNIAFTQSSSKDVSIDCSAFDALGRCLLCNLDNCTLCSNFDSLPEGYYVDPVLGCGPITCSSKFTNCSRCNKDKCFACESGYAFDSTNNCVENTCQAGYILKNDKCYKIPSSQAECDKFGALYFNNTCITKINAGDDGGPSINNINGVTPLNVGKTCKTGSCCWTGVAGGAHTASTTNDDMHKQCTSSGLVGNITVTGSALFNYIACNRTVCQQPAARLICAAYSVGGTSVGDWRLPSNSDFGEWANHITEISIGVGPSGLQLCDYSSTGTASTNKACSPKSPRCYYEKNCFGSNLDVCYPYHVWGEDMSGLLSCNNIRTVSRDANWALSVRCVLDAYLE